jgi:hypothetical protein
MTGRPMKMPLSQTLMRDTFRTGVNLGRFQVPLYGLVKLRPTTNLKLSDTRARTSN